MSVTSTWNKPSERKSLRQFSKMFDENPKIAAEK